MKEIKLTKGLIAIVDDCDFDLLIRFYWNAQQHPNTYYATRGFYIATSSGCKHYAVLMHRQILGLDPEDSRDVDHINKYGLDNRRENLRICSRSENMYNQGIRSNNSSGFKGVYFYKEHRYARPWQAFITVAKRRKHIGYFASALEAAIAYDENALKLHGEFASLNFSLENYK